MANAIVNCVSNAYDALKRASFEVVRAVRRQQRRRANVVRRPSAFRLAGFDCTPPECRVESAPSALEPLGKRKRGGEEEGTMVTKKARFASSPWANEKWAEYGHGRALTPSKAVSGAVKAILDGYYPSSPHQIKLAKRLREERKSKPRKGRSKFTTYPPRYEPYRASDRKSRKSPIVHLTLSPSPQREFWDSDIEKTPSPEKKSISEETSNAEMAAKENKNITSSQIPIPPSQITITSSKMPISPSQIPALEEKLRLHEEEHPIMDLADESDLDWEANEDPLFRATLRALPESTNPQGFRIPINGWVSPETQKYNIRHAEKLVDAEETIEPEVVEETPSKLPPRPSKIERMRTVLPRWAVLNKDPNRTGTNFVDPDKYPEVPLSKFEMAQNNLFDSARATKTESATVTPSKWMAAQSSPALSAKRTIKQEEIAESSALLASKLASVKISPSENEKDTTQDKAESSSEPAKKEQRFKFQTPAKQIYTISIHNDDVPKQAAADLDRNETPKAQNFGTQRTVRTTRAHKLKEALEAEKVQDPYTFEPLGPEWIKKVKAAAIKGHGEVRGSDMVRAVPQYSTDKNQSPWVNDEVINAYMAIVAKHGRRGDPVGDPSEMIPSHHAFVTFFYTKLSKDGPGAVLRWSKRAKVGGKALLETEKIYIPVNENYHWTLCVVEAKNHKKITVYNSLGSSRNRAVCNTVLAWIEKELKEDFNKDEWTLDPHGYTAQQTNSDDCGVFAITTARQIMLGKMGTMEAGAAREAYTADIIPMQRKRIVAEIINDGLLASDESKV